MKDLLLIGNNEYPQREGNSHTIPVSNLNHYKTADTRSHEEAHHKRAKNSPKELRWMLSVREKRESPTEYTKLMFAS